MMDFPLQINSRKAIVLHVSNFMMGEIATITKTAQKKIANQIDIKLLNSANGAAACLVELDHKECEKTFQHLQKCKNTWQSKLKVKHRNLPMKVVKMKKKMTNRCQK
jgi:hypothetical protein